MASVEHAQLNTSLSRIEPINTASNAGSTTETQAYAPVNGAPSCCDTCKAECIFCCIGCLTCVGCRNYLSRKTVFAPPTPSFYAFEDAKGGGSGTGVGIEMMRVSRDAFEQEDIDFAKKERFTAKQFTISPCRVETKRGNKIACVYLRRDSAQRTILMSHGNATDLGLLSFHLEEMVQLLNVNVFAYDYTGYGESDRFGKPSPRDLIADAEAAYTHVTGPLGVKSGDIVLYGQSLGSCATCHLASRHPVLGAVIHSGLSSIIRVLDPGMKRTRWYDFFANVDLVRRTQCPIFVIHGDNDEAVPFSHGEALYDAASSRIDPWFVENGGHNDIEQLHFREYYTRLRDAMRKFASFPRKTATITKQPGAAGSQLDAKVSI